MTAGLSGVPACPVEVLAVRHGQSLANAAFMAANASGRPVEGLADRDADVALSELGREQSAALGRWLAGRQLNAVYCSPYLRARQTRDLAIEQLDTAHRPVTQLVDERLRDREMGQMELLTKASIRQRFPDEWERRQRVGPFYYRPLGGESFADVALRMRSFLADLVAAEQGQRVLVVAHDAIVLVLRYLTEALSVSDFEKAGLVENTSVSRWDGTSGRLRLVEYGAVGHLHRA